MAYRASLEPYVCLVWHDPGAQLSVPRALTVETTDDARAWISARGTLPRLTVVRRDTADRVAQLALSLKSVTLILDELDQVCAGKRWLSEAARDIVHYGRHLRVALMGTFRRTQNVHEDLIAMADTAFIFRHSSGSPRDIDAVKDRFGSEYAEVAQRLEPMQFVTWRDS